MGFQITDASSGLSASVYKGQNGRGRLNADARTALRAYYASRDAGQAFSAQSHDATAAAGTLIFYLKNTSSTLSLFIDLMRFGGVESCLWKVWSVTGTAAGGNAITPTNINLSSGVAAAATCRGDDAITGLTQVAEIATIRSAATQSATLQFEAALILGTNDAIAVEQDAGTTGIAEVFCRFFFEDIRA